jgi:hypothetical protein
VSGSCPIVFYNPRWKQSAEEVGRRPVGNPGHFAWIVKTFQVLKDQGFACDFAQVLPQEGVILAHRDHLPDELRPGPRQLLVCVVADTRRHPYAQIHVVQNPGDELVGSPSALWPSSFMPHWPEWDLIPRDAARKDTCKNVAYFGQPERLAEEFRAPAWGDRLRRLGFTWRIAAPETWNDFSEVDVIVAVRSFDRRTHHRYPASKLYNAWCAGVPAILGYESAYRSERRGELDYIEATSEEEVITALARLRDDPALYRAIVANGAARAREVTFGEIAARWKRLIEEDLVPAHAKWYASDGHEREAFFQRRRRSYLQYRLRHWLSRTAEYALVAIQPLMRSAWKRSSHSENT